MQTTARRASARRLPGAVAQSRFRGERAGRRLPDITESGTALLLALKLLATAPLFPWTLGFSTSPRPGRCCSMPLPISLGSAALEARETTAA